MEQSPITVNLDKAMLIAQKQITGATKDSRNPHFKSNFASLQEIMESCKKQFNDAGLYVTQLLDSDGTNDFLITMIVHAETGEFRSTKMKLHEVSGGIQRMMSEQSYLKRYMLQALAFMPALDDDGEATMDRKPTQAVSKPAQVPVIKDEGPSIAQETITKTPFRRAPKDGGF